MIEISVFDLFSPSHEMIRRLSPGEVKVTFAPGHPLKQPEMPPRGVPDCTCLKAGKPDEFITLHGPNGDGKPLWYARKTCPIHGIRVTESPPENDSTLSTPKLSETTPTTPA